MRLGLLADIHEHNDHLRAAISALQSKGVDRFVVLGDLFETGKHVAETAAELARVGAVGVWGNHDFGLCREVHESTLQKYAPAVLDFFARLHPSLEIEGHWFQHIEPWLNSESVEDLWYCWGDETSDAARSFAAVPSRRIFMGHRHRWSARTPTEALAWKGESPLQFQPDERYLVIVHGVFDGWCALLDTEADVLEPIRVG